jgi:hypothetical protein
MVVLSCDPSDSCTEAVHTSVYIAITNVRATQPINLEKFVEVGCRLAGRFCYCSLELKSQLNKSAATHAGTEVKLLCSPLKTHCNP